MKKKQVTEENNYCNKLTETDLQMPELIGLEPEEPNADLAQAPASQTGLTRSASDDSGDFSDVKQYPEDPFSYHASNHENVQLSSGTFQYDVTDFVLPGRDGFDVTMTRRYDSSCANLTDMDPYVTFNRMRTGSRDNDHNKQKYGLGYGWSFVLPSIETVPYIGFIPLDERIRSITYYNYILHLEDGRSLGMSYGSNAFNDYYQKDVLIESVSGSITHPYDTGTVKKYHAVIRYKDGNSDYFNAVTEPEEKSHGPKRKYTLVAREDRFGNVICYHLNDYGGMTIVDTWGRKISLNKTSNGFAWTLPEAEMGKTCEFKYQIDFAHPLKLTSVTDPAGRETKYDYHHLEGTMKYASKKNGGSANNTNPRPYLLLKNVTHPTRTVTQFEYGDKVDIVNEIGGRIGYFPLANRKDMANQAEHNRVDYAFLQDTNETGNSFIQHAEVKKQNDLLETCTFNDQGSLLQMEVRHSDLLIAQNTYQYCKWPDHKQMASAVEKTFNRQDPSQVLEKKTSWSYTTDRKINVTKVTEEYSNDSCNDQETNTLYADNNMIIETNWKKGSDTIRETNELHSDKNNLVVRYKRIYENDVLKEKIEYEYSDPKNPYCVTNEKRYLQTSNQNLDQANDYKETVYQYNSSQYTHAAVSSEIKGIKDADNQSIASIKEVFAYDQWGRMIRKTDAKGQISTIRYDLLGRVVEETLPQASGQLYQTKTEYNDLSNHLTQTDANHQKKRIEYTPLGQIARVCLVDSEPSSATIILQDYQYDAQEELKQVITYDGTGTTAKQIKKTEQYTYDAFGKVLSRKIPQVGYEEIYQYDEVFTDPADKKNYFREQKTVKGDSFSPDVVTVLFQDLKGNTRKAFLAGERVATYEYDNVGNKIKQIDDQNQVERWEYDYAGRVVKAIRTVDQQDRASKTQYDTLGNKRYQIDEAGKETEFQYDKAGRFVKMIAPFDSRRQITKYVYDAVGNIIWEKKAQQNGWLETQHVYDQRNRLTETCQYLHKEPNTLSGARWIGTKYRYDTMGNVTEMRTGNTQSGEGNQVTKYTYDRFGNILTLTDARGKTERYQYDKIGVLQTKTDRNGNKTVYQYDALGRPLKMMVTGQTADGLVSSEQEYGYSKSGQTIWEGSRQTEPGRGSVLLESRFYFNHKGQLIRQQDPGGATKEYTYDSHGNRQSFKLTRAGQTAPDVPLYYYYDDSYRLKQVRKDSAGGMVLAEYDYDVSGNRKTLRSPQNGLETHYRYNDGNCMISMENKRQGIVISAWEYAYDVDGNLLSKTDKSGSSRITTTYRYDRLGRLIEENDPSWKRTIYEYDAYSNRVRMLVEGKTKEETIHVTTYHYTLNNLLEKEIKKHGKTTETHQYRYDDNGNETFRIWEKTAPRPEYPGEVWLCGTRRKNPTVYEWRQYNGFNQLIRIFQDDGEISYQYRRDGLRHSRTVKRLTEREAKTNVFYWDGANIVAEQTNREQIKTYLRGINLIARQMDGMLYYYLYNAHGDVTQLRDQKGSPVRSYEYDAFGNEKDLWDEDPNPFRYCGEYFDTETDTIYLRARDYRAATGRFLTEDSVEKTTRKMANGQEIIDPLSLNKYTYCYNNPVIFEDPSGHVPFFIATGAIGAIIGAIAAGVKSAMDGNFSLKEVGKGAMIGGAIGLTGGLAIAFLVTGSAIASSGAVMTGLGFGAAASAGVGGAAGAQQIAETTNKTLKFGDNDLVYGIYSNPSIRELQQSAGGKFLSSFIRPDGMSWIDYSKQMIEKTIAEGNIIRFNLTNMDVYKSLMGVGEYAQSITIQELRYIQENWGRLSHGVKFYQKGVEVIAPWIK